MKRTATILLLLAPFGAGADERQACTVYAEAVITGQRIPCGFLQICDAEELLRRANKKGYACEPLDPYLELATLRLQLRGPVQQERHMPPRRQILPSATFPTYSPPPPFPTQNKQIVCRTLPEPERVVCTEM